jgi:hypothetical protein
MQASRSDTRVASVSFSRMLLEKTYGIGGTWQSCGNAGDTSRATPYLVDSHTRTTSLRDNLLRMHVPAN